MTQDLESKYHEITALYDMAEDLLSTVESEFVSDPEAQLMLVEPLVSRMGESTDVLTEEFIAVVEKKGTYSAASKTRIEAALRKMLVAIEEYNKRAAMMGKMSAQAFRNIADPLVEKIQKHIEQVVVMFLDYVQLSLERIMHKNEIEEMKQREEKVALMLHQMGY